MYDTALALTTNESAVTLTILLSINAGVAVIPVTVPVATNDALVDL